MSDSLVLVINSGSSSLKFAVINAHNGHTSLSGIGERLGTSGATISWKYDGEKSEYAITDEGDHHQACITRIVDLLESLALSDAIVAVGHRIVHGGERFTQSVRIDESVLSEIERLSDLAPLHNPAGAKGIRAAMQAFAGKPQFAVFDTAFHQSMPAKAYTTGINYALYEQYGIRSYGFHGTSHYYVSREAARMLNKDVASASFISVHLGNGASVCAIENGKSLDTSMSFTPLAGLMMGTRSGDIDPGVIEFLLKKGWSSEQVFECLNRQSGFLGVSGISADTRSVLEAMEQGNERARLAVDVFSYRVAKYIAAYLVPLSRLDGIIFTGGIGENSVPIRSEILRNLGMLGFVEDSEANAQTRLGAAGVIAHSELFNTPVLVVPTNEEWVIAQQSVALL